MFDELVGDIVLTCCFAASGCCNHPVQLAHCEVTLTFLFRCLRFHKPPVSPPDFTVFFPRGKLGEASISLGKLFGLCFVLYVRNTLHL